MKLEDQVSSLQPSLRLKELGVKQESYFYWGDKGLQHVQPKSAQYAKWASAFTVAELGDILRFCGEADALAEMLIYLLENHLITVEEVNARIAA